MNLIRTHSADGTCILTFDRPGSSANVFDCATLEELDEHLAALERESGVRGVVLASAKPKIFIAGADLNAFRNAPAETLGQVLELGQRVFTRLGRLPIPSVAAIHGACLGGGLEVALACDWRIASTDRATKLGLPETQLGIVPAWGGSTRLPKLIGLPQALGLIVPGRQIVGAQALKLGVVDDLAHPEYLLDAARGLLARGKRRQSAPRIMSRPPLTWVVAAKARRDVRAKTHGHYPAPLRAIDVCSAAASESLESGLAREKAAFLELIGSPECGHLMNVFFLQERAKKLRPPALAAAPVGDASVAARSETRARPAAEHPSVRSEARRAGKVAVIGAGTMGAGIAQWVSARGMPVRLKDINPKALARGLHAIEKVYADAVKRRVFTAVEATAGLDRIVPLHTEVPLRDVDLVIEAAVEKLELKQQVFREIERAVGPDTILATNTSALSIDALASALERPERVVGLHFFNPVHRMQLVEIVRGPRTSDAALETALQFVKDIGKLPVIANDSPGFLVNRILLPYLVEAVWLFSEGVPVVELDRLMLDFGMPMGPLRLCDEVGLDVAQHVAKDLERRLREPVPINDTLEKMVAKGWLGRKSGRGFYLHGAKRDSVSPNPEARELQAPHPRVSNRQARTDRMVLVMINEAARVLEEGVVESPDDVDFAMIMGTGWAPFRGGPLRYADTLGAPEIVRRLGQLARDVAPHFSPCRRLREMARDNGTFHGSPHPGAATESTAPIPAGTPGRDPGAVDVPLVTPAGDRVGARDKSAAGPTTPRPAASVK